jgi:hypothetical protein
MTVASLLAPVATALADSQTSSNWSGYAVHGNRQHFRQVSGEWRVPRVDCSSGMTTYSAMWAGIGGFSATSNALEQTGTEADCNGHQADYWAWYELVPAASHTLSLRVHPGDLMRALVVVRGRRVTLALTDLTRHHGFSRAFTPKVIDTTSAEWILEAPGTCSGSRCVTLPLSNFQRAGFSHARVVPASGRAGAIAGAHWNRTRITLSAAGRRFVGGGSSIFAGGAIPGGLSAAGSAFSLRYTPPADPQNGQSAGRQTS